VIVSDEAFAYLSLQRGAISDLRGDRSAWEAAYQASLQADFEDLEPWLPMFCEAILDVGSGLGGIDLLLARHYVSPEVVLLDGFNDPAEHSRHDRTFSNASAALRFFEANGGPRPGFIDTDFREAHDVDQFDLVVSLHAWCFHFPPEAYLDAVLGLCAPGARLILDVRNEKGDWLECLNHRLIPVGIARRAQKFTRRVYAAP